MTLFQRAATFAAMTLCLGGFISTSSQGRAAELDRPAITNAVLTAPVQQLNVPAPAPVPEISQALEPATFDSLDEAVAAQDLAAEDEALRCLATTIYYESKGEPLAGQLAVAQVVLNRVKSGRFASDVCGVVKQRGQFSFVRAGVLPTIDAARPAYRTALGIAKVALADAWKNSPAPKALYFHARRVGAPARAIKVASIGNHVFFR